MACFAVTLRPPLHSATALIGGLMASPERPAPWALAALVHLVLLASVLIMAGTAWFLRTSGMMGPASPDDGAGLGLLLFSAPARIGPA